ncbi:uncharacterized protein LOC134848320 [Symsagittifera roscoffensis]|uniref:uncharacterized protein LOC134848320 n=1 Tax=Symsagittifera roscoffensis TaxID=84072 RepID=UPI00307BE8BB
MKICIFSLAESGLMKSKMTVHLVFLALMICKCSAGSTGSTTDDGGIGFEFECHSSSLHLCEPVQTCFDNRDCTISGQFCCGSACMATNEQTCQPREFTFLVPLTAVIGTLCLVLIVYIVFRCNAQRLCHPDEEQHNLHSRVVGFVRNVTSADDINQRNLQPASVIGMTLNVNDFHATAQPQPTEDDELKPRLPKYSLNLQDAVVPEAHYVMRFAEPPNSRRTNDLTTHEPDEAPPAYNIPGTPEIRRELNQQNDTGSPPDYQSSISTISSTQIDDSVVYQYAMPPPS